MKIYVITYASYSDNDYELFTETKVATTLDEALIVRDGYINYIADNVIEDFNVRDNFVNEINGYGIEVDNDFTFCNGYEMYQIKWTTFNV